MIFETRTRSHLDGYDAGSWGRLNNVKRPGKFSAIYHSNQILNHTIDPGVLIKQTCRMIHKHGIRWLNQTRDIVSAEIMVQVTGFI